MGVDYVSCGGTHDRYSKTIRLLDGTKRTSLLYRYSIEHFYLCIAIADAFFRGCDVPKPEDPIIQASLDAQGFAGLIASLYIGVVIMILTTIGSMVLYLYPRRTTLWPRVTAIVVMAVWWVATNAHILFGGYIPDIVKVWAGKALPAFTGSPLVYITPSVFEICAIALSVAIGLGKKKKSKKLLLKKSHFTKVKPLLSKKA